MAHAAEEAKSKAEPLVGVILTLLALLLLAGALTFAGPCDVHAHPAGETPVCIWAQRAALAAGAVCLVISLVRVFEMDEGERRGLSFSAALIGLSAALVPGVVIGLCADASMRCNALMRPFILCVGLAIFAVGAADLVRRLLRLRAPR